MMVMRFKEVEALSARNFADLFEKCLLRRERERRERVVPSKNPVLGGLLPLLLLYSLIANLKQKRERDESERKSRNPRGFFNLFCLES